MWWRSAVLLVFAAHVLFQGVDGACHHDCKDCVNNTCSCQRGTGGLACEFSMKSIYREHASHVFHNVKLREFDASGWGAAKDVYRSLFQQVNAQFIVEVGVWKGSSSLMFAGFLKEQDKGVLLCVDTWLGSITMWDRPEGEHNKEFDLMWVHGRPTVYHTFISNVVQSNLTDYVVPFSVPSSVAAEFMIAHQYQADLIHIDAGHGYEDVKLDIGLWWRAVRPGGIMMGDDFFWPGVARAAEEYANTTGLKLHVQGVKWWIFKPESSQ